MSEYLHGFNLALQPVNQLFVTRMCLVQLGIGLLQRRLCLQQGQWSHMTAVIAEPVNQLPMFPAVQALLRTNGQGGP